MANFLDSIGGIGGAISGIGAIAGLFGGKPNYGSAGDLSAGRSYLGQLGSIGGQYGSLASQNFGQYNADNGQYRNAVSNYANYLQQDPYTDQYSTAQLARSTAGGADAYQRARANLQASGAARGIGGGNSSMLSGGLAGIEASQAGNLANNQNALALSAIQQHQQRLGQLTDLYGGISGQDYSRGVGALGSQQGIDSQLAGDYLQQGNMERGLEQNQQAQVNQGFGAALGGLAGGIGSMAGYNAAGGYGGGYSGYGGYSTPGIAPSPYPTYPSSGSGVTGSFTYSPVTYGGR